MVIFDWLSSVQYRLKFWRTDAAQRRTRRIKQSRFPAATEVFERRQMLSATAVADSYQITSSMSPQPVTLDVLANDSTNSGPLTITSFSTVAYGSVSKITGTPYGSPNHDELSFTPQAGYTGTESFTYTVTDAASSQSTATVTLTITGTSAPVVGSLSTSSGSTAGGTSVTISGSGFSQVSAVLFGGSMASSYTVNSSSSITAVAPARSAGSVDITVVTSMGSSSTNANDRFTYQTPTGVPSVTSVSPGTETTSGGDTITISGTNFTGVTGVSFGGTSATSYTETSPTSITAVAPSHVSGQVDVQVTSYYGTSATNSGDKLTFTTPILTPAVTSLSSNSGATTGGSSITIMGTNFTNVTQVNFGSVAVTSFTVNSSGSITAIVPAESASTVDVTVTNSAGTSGQSQSDKFTFASTVPAVSSLSVSSGSSSGGSAVTLIGSNFTGATGILFGSTPASSYTINSPTSLTAIVPAEAPGVVDITVQSYAGTSIATAADRFTFTAPPPTVGSLSASMGLTTGGDSIIISGSNLSTATGVMFGNVSANSFAVNVNGTITAVTPAESAGVVDVTVITPAGTSATCAADQFSFQPPGSGGSGTGLQTPNTQGLPVIDGLSTYGASSTGGDAVTIFGAGFSSITAVKIGTVAATSFVINSDNSVTAIIPAMAAGTVTVSAQSPAGTSVVAGNAVLTITNSTATPSVTAVALSSNSSGAGSLVSIQGSNFTNVSNVSFGGASALFIVQSPTTIMAMVPSGVTGSVNVSVTNGNGTSTTSAANSVNLTGTNLQGPSGTSSGSNAYGSSTSGEYVVPSNAATPVLASNSSFRGSTGPGETPIPYVSIHPETTTSGGAGGYTSTTTDGGTTGSSQVMVNTLPNGWVETIRITMSETLSSVSSMTESYGGGSSSSQNLSVQMTYGTSDTIVAANGTGYTRLNVETTTETYASSTSNGTMQYSSNDLTQTSISDLEVGLGSTAGTDQATASLVESTMTDNSSSGTTTSAGTSTGQFSSQSSETDQCDHTDNDSVGTNQTIGGGATGSTGSGGGSTVGGVPIVTGLSAGAGSMAGGTTVTIYGENFLGATAVLFGGVNALSFAVDSDTEISAISPVAPSGVTDVHVVGPGGTSASSSADQFASIAASTTMVFSDVSSQTSANSDQSSDLSAGTFTINPDGTESNTDTYHQSSSGNDTYSDSATSRSATVKLDTTGTTVIYDNSTSSDTGADAYLSSDSGTSSTAANGTTTSSDSSNSNDSGTENQTQSDQGWQQSDETLSDGTVTSYYDNSTDSNQDQSHYSDSDVRTASTATGGTDTSSINSGDNNTFSTSDRVNETDTLKNTYGTATITKTIDTSGDAGTTTDSGANSDTETLGVGETDQGDAITFDNSSNEQDNSSNSQSSITTTIGQVGPGELLNSTETYTEADAAVSSQTTADPGTESLLPTGSIESDTASQTSTTSDHGQNEDTLVSSDAVTQSGGTTSTSTLNNDDTGVFTSGDTASTGDVHTNTANADGSSNVSNDDDTSSENSSDADQYGQNDNSSQTTTTPVSGGSATAVNGTTVVASGVAGNTDASSSETNTAAPNVDYSTDTSGSTNTDSGTQTNTNTLSMNAVDPVTGVATVIQNRDVSTDGFTDDDGISVTNAISATNTSSTESGQLHKVAGDTITDIASQYVSVDGNPSPGVTVDYQDSSSTTDHGGDSDNNQDVLTAIGTDSGSDVFSSFDNISLTDAGHSNLSQQLSTNDGHGNTTSNVDSSHTTFGNTGTLTDADSGSETFSNANGVATTDNETDTDTQGGNLNPTQTVTTSNSDGTVSLDPTTGLTKTTAYIASSSDAVTEQDLSGSVDVHSASLTNGGSDVTSGSDSASGSELASDSVSNTVRQVGLLSAGEAVNVTNQYVQFDNSQDSYVNSDVLTLDGTDTNTTSVSGTFNTPTMYDAHFGTTSTTDPTTGITTTNAFSNIIDASSSDAAKTGATLVTPPTGVATTIPTSSDTGTLEQAWSLANVMYQTNASGAPIGTVTITTDVGGATEPKLNGSVATAVLTDTQVSTITAAGTIPPAAPVVPVPGAVLNAEVNNGSNVPAPGNPNPQANAMQQAAQALQNGALVAAEQNAGAPGAVPAGNAQGAAAGQNGLAGAMPGGQNANGANPAVPQPNIPQPANNQPAGSIYNTPAALTSAQLQALKAEYGPLTFIIYLPSYNITRGYRVPCNVYRALDGSSIYVNAKTGAVIKVEPAGNAGNTNYYANDPSKMDTDLWVFQKTTWVVASTTGAYAAAGTRATAILWRTASYGRMAWNWARGNSTTLTPGEQAIANVRGAGITDCEAAASAINKAMGPGGKIVYLPVRVGNHTAYFKGGTWYDPTGLAYVLKNGYWTEAQLAAAGLLNAARNGIFTPQQYEAFLKPFCNMPIVK